MDDTQSDLRTDRIKDFKVQKVWKMVWHLQHTLHKLLHISRQLKRRAKIDLHSVTRFLLLKMLGKVFLQVLVIFDVQPTRLPNTHSS